MMFSASGLSTKTQWSTSNMPRKSNSWQNEDKMQYVFSTWVFLETLRLCFRDSLCSTFRSVRICKCIYLRILSLNYIPLEEETAHAGVACLWHKDHKLWITQGCVLSPLLFSLDINSCTSSHQSVKLLKFVTTPPSLNRFLMGTRPTKTGDWSSGVQGQVQTASYHSLYWGDWMQPATHPWHVHLTDS